MGNTVARVVTIFRVSQVRPAECVLKSASLPEKIEVRQPGSACFPFPVSTPQIRIFGRQPMSEASYFVAVCPNCLVSLNVKTIYSGNYVRCKHCDQKFRALA